MSTFANFHFQVDHTFRPYLIEIRNLFHACTIVGVNAPCSLLTTVTFVVRHLRSLLNSSAFTTPKYNDLSQITLRRYCTVRTGDFDSRPYDIFPTFVISVLFSSWMVSRSGKFLFQI